MAAGLVFTGQGRFRSSFFAPARTEIPLFRALVAVVGAARAGVADARKSGFRCDGWHRPGSDPIGGVLPMGSRSLMERRPQQQQHPREYGGAVGSRGYREVVVVGVMGRGPTA